MASEAAVAEVLGIEDEAREPLSPLGLIDRVDRGLPLAALDRVARKVAPGDRAFPHRLVPRATLARRRRAPSAQQRLSPDEGARVARLADVWVMAREVWGSDEAARAFMFRPHPLLEDRRPIDVLVASEFGRPLVEGILGRLQYGSAA